MRFVIAMTIDIPDIDIENMPKRFWIRRAMVEFERCDGLIICNKDMKVIADIDRVDRIIPVKE